MNCFFLPIGKLRLDFQPPEYLYEGKVAGMVEAMQQGEFLPAVVVRFDGNDYFLQEGFHRVEAANRCGHCAIHAEVSPGTLAKMEAEFREVMHQMKGKW